MKLFYTHYSFSSDNTLKTEVKVFVFKPVSVITEADIFWRDLWVTCQQYLGRGYNYRS